MAEWKTDGEWGAKFDAPAIHGIARPAGDFELWFGDHLLEGDGRTRSLDAAKAAAEQALREMHDALAAHFAPVLRWPDPTTTASGRSIVSVARVSEWRLEARGTGYWQADLLNEDGCPYANIGAGEAGDMTAARRAAEAALRSLGVVFRTEGE